ncbi:BON domain-containing protein [Tunturiibacter gelidoferens]|uniref:Osmotically-inducible protein OsmY n=4 Tax=Tunturiibacter TaxID=3154218 RepID=A0A7Y9NK81_9BACT|nr:BON domain-containing protein [Edaphobacter lichenicola]MBB5339758.1 osmotically-inducible protein OsmY [Edaphobacter lichenicola]NYF50920.1 osmotically-inducible protein OsmY [Edaphobacter lichenicola]
MKALRFILLASAALACTFFTTTLPTSRAIAQSSDQTTPPDNSKQNKAQQPTADTQAHGGTSDRQTTAQIRKAIIADKSLSTYAHNVKIITVNGTVTLKGPVSSDDEKQKVASVAASVVSADKVTNDLTVK